MLEKQPRPAKPRGEAGSIRAAEWPGHSASSSSDPVDPVNSNNAASVRAFLYGQYVHRLLMLRLREMFYPSDISVATRGYFERFKRWLYQPRFHIEVPANC